MVEEEWVANDNIEHLAQKVMRRKGLRSEISHVAKEFLKTNESSSEYC
ncbi:hypothetical protein AVEN_156081-1, partial [Araneus ventricosus]